MSWAIFDVLQFSRISGYQQVLTFLLQVNRAKYVLHCASTISQKRERKGMEGDTPIVHAVRLKLLWFVNSLLHYLGDVVIPNWRETRCRLFSRLCLR